MKGPERYSFMSGLVLAAEGFQREDWAKEREIRRIIRVKGLVRLQFRFFRGVSQFRPRVRTLVVLSGARSKPEQSTFD